MAAAQTSAGVTSSSAFLEIYRLEVWDGANRAAAFDARVVGKKDTPTPIFNAQMTYLVFAPYWNVPADIASKETIPVGDEGLRVPEQDQHGCPRPERGALSIRTRSI